MVIFTILSPLTRRFKNCLERMRHSTISTRSNVWLLSHEVRTHQLLAEGVDRVNEMALSAPSDHFICFLAGHWFGQCRRGCRSCSASRHFHGFCFDRRFGDRLYRHCGYHPSDCYGFSPYSHHLLSRWYLSPQGDTMLPSRGDQLSRGCGATLFCAFVARPLHQSVCRASTDALGGATKRLQIGGGGVMHRDLNSICCG